jgi:hypothetical protein
MVVAKTLQLAIGDVASREEVVQAEREVDMSNLKRLARNILPTDSKLRMLIESEKETIPYGEWLIKMEIYERLLDDETKYLPSRSPTSS